MRRVIAAPGSPHSSMPNAVAARTSPLYQLSLFQSLRFKLFLVLFLTVLVVQGFAGWFIVARMERGFDAQMRDQALSMGKLTQALYDQRGQALLDSARLIAAMPIVQDAVATGDRKRLVSVAATMATQMPGTTMSFFTANGQALWRSYAPDAFGDFDSRDMIGLRLALKGQANSSAEDAAMLGPALHGFAPVMRDGDVVGAISVNERFDQDLMERTKQATGYAAAILDADGVPLAWTEDPVHSGTMLRPSVPQQAIAAIQSGHQFTVVTYINNVPFGSYALPLRDPEGKLIGIVGVTTSMSELGAARAAVRQGFLLIVVLAFLMTLGLAWVLSRSLIDPLRQLTTAATRIAGGSYDLPAGVRAKNEIGVLAQAFDHMRERVGFASNALLEAKATAENERNLVNAILNSTHDGIIMFNAEQHFQMANSRWVDLFGVPSKELIGKAAADVSSLVARQFAKPEEFDQTTSALLAQPLQVQQRDEFEQIRPVRRILRRYSAPVYDATEQVIGRIFAYQDVTREHQSDGLKSALISIVSHELRLPLTSIKGYARTLLMDDPPWAAKERREFLQYIDEESDKLSEMVDNLLDVSKIEAGVLQVQRHDLLMPVLIRKTVERQQSMLAGVSVTIALPDPFPVVEADGQRVEQVLYNLLDNAVKYGKAGGTVVISGSVCEHEVRITVADDGNGIPAEHAELVFERFYQVDRSLSRQAGGSGLGLSICRGIIEAHEGRIWVEPRKPGDGCAITFALPLARRQATEEVPHLEREAAAGVAAIV
jgi:two-component system phosphate regulon sensor histidine kinase PhoR